MNRRSSAIVFGAAVGGCLILLVCTAVLGVSFFLVAARANPLSSLVPAAGNRIVTVGNDGNIYVMDAAGKSRAQLTKDGDAGTAKRYDFPTWAPDGRHIAYVGITYSNANPTSAALYSSDPGGGPSRTLFQSDQSFPFYLYWSPDSRNVTFLASKNGSDLTLNVADTAGDQDSVKQLESGSPLYWAWSPDAKHLFLHIGGTRDESDSAQIAILPFGQSAHSLSVSPGSFQAPSISPDGQHLLFSQEGDNSKQTVTVSNADGAEARPLFDYKGRISLGWSPDGNRIAYIVTDSSMNLPTFGAVHVVGADGKNDQSIADHVLAFIWSPNGHRLAYLTVPANGNSTSFYRFKGLAQTGGNDVKLEWQVKDFDTGQSHTLGVFAPTDSFISTLPFFDQYTRSTTFWSPDSAHFVYTNADTTDAGSIWVADAAGNTAPKKIGEGMIAFWSLR
ncbi:MAG: TolB family protein [Rudaea sp.]